MDATTPKASGRRFTSRKPAACSRSTTPLTIRLTDGAVQVADVVEQPPARLEDAVQLAVERAGVQIPGKLNRRRIVDDARERLGGERLDFLEAVADAPLDLAGC